MTWNALNELIGEKQSTRFLPNSLKDENNEVNDPKLIANKFNDFFVDVGPNLARQFNNDTDHFGKFLEGNYTGTMFSYEKTSDEVKKVIEKLDSKTSCGIDEISSKVVKYVAPYISIPLSHVFNFTFATGKIPNQLKIPLVTPIIYVNNLKKKNSNYRPKPVLSCFSKVLEKLMYKRLIVYVDKKDFI